MARKPVTVSLPEELVKETARFCRARSVSLSEIAREALRDYLYRQELEQVRKAFTTHVQKRGISSEKALLKALDD